MEQETVQEELDAFWAQSERIFEEALDWALVNILSEAALLQIVVIVSALIIARLAKRGFKSLLERLTGARAQRGGGVAARLLRTVKAIATPLLWAVILWLAGGAAEAAGQPTALIRLADSLLVAYVAIRIASTFIPSAYWSSVFAWAAWSAAALNAVGLLDPAIDLMRASGVKLGEVEITVWTVVKGAAVSGLLIWIALVVGELAQRRLDTAPSLSPGLRLLLGKLTRIGLIILALVVGLTVVGVDLTAFAVFTGAIGIGVGLGLQRTIANLVAGFSLLADKSLKPGDVIEVETSQGPTYGVVGKMTARYVSVRTRDGTETLIPNETLIANAVTNWSHSDKRVRRKLAIGVAYDADVELARKLAIEAALASPRILRDPKPACLLKGFGDSSIDLELRIWLEDPEEGVSNIASEVLLEVWRRFREADIEIPYPQRDLRIRSGLEALRGEVG